MNKKYIVRLSQDERKVCTEVVKNLKGTSQKVRRAQILLKADADGPAWVDQKICEAFDCRVQTVENIRKQFVLEGFEAALERKKRSEPPTPAKLDGKQEAKLIALRLGNPSQRCHRAACPRGAMISQRRGLGYFKRISTSFRLNGLEVKGGSLFFIQMRYHFTMPRMTLKPPTMVEPPYSFAKRIRAL